MKLFHFTLNSASHIQLINVFLIVSIIIKIIMFLPNFKIINNIQILFNHPIKCLMIQKQIKILSLNLNHMNITKKQLKKQQSLFSLKYHNNNNNYNHKLLLLLQKELNTISLSNMLSHNKIINLHSNPTYLLKK